MATTTAAPTTAIGGHPDGYRHNGHYAGNDDHVGLSGKHGDRPGMFHRDSQPGFPDYGDRRRIANPSPTGLFALAATTLMWSLFNARARDIFQVNAIVGMALLVGGLCTLLAGMWEFRIGNTFGATAFTLLGGFWGAYGLMYWPSSGALSAYNSNTDLGSALGIFFMVWMVVALMLLLGSLRSSVPVMGTFFFLFLMYLLVGAAHFTGRTSVLRAGGILGCLASVLAFYAGAVGLHNRDTTYYALPHIPLPKRHVDNTTARY